MKKVSKTHLITVLVFLVLNITAIVLVTLSVVKSIRAFQADSFEQTVDNIQTLTDTSVDKVKLIVNEKKEDMQSITNYVSSYHNTGMTLEQLKGYIEERYSSTSTNWQIIDAERVTPTSSSTEKTLYNGVCFSNNQWTSVSYDMNSNEKLSQILCLAKASQLGKITFTTEFLDISCYEKVFAITSVIRVIENEDYKYKTFMLVIRSEAIQNIIDNSSNVEELEYEDFSKAVIDKKGSYVFSTTAFQGYNFLQYLSIYNPSSFSNEKKDDLTENLRKENFAQVMFYKNNRNQDCVFSITSISGTDWLLVSTVPTSSFHYIDTYSTYFFYFAIAIAFLVGVNFSFVFLINYRLRKKTKEANHANMAKSNFLSSMSHDIRTPMNAIIGMTSLASDELQKDTPDLDSLGLCIKTIQSSGNNLITLINDILDISKIESGKILLSSEELSITETLNHNVELVRQEIKAKNFDFEVHVFNVKHEMVISDELRLNQIFMNIIGNAIKYTNEGKITISLSEDEIPGDTTHARYVFSVKDTGIGMSEEFLKNIFDRFSRAVDTRINKVQGTGLGMAIVKKIVDLMHGKIEVQSTINVGSNFTITLDLPVVLNCPTMEEIVFSKIMVIDDDKIILETIKASLSNYPIQIDSFEESSKAIDYLVNNETNYDAILVDWKMPVLSGKDLVSKIRTLTKETTKIYVISAYNLEDIDKDAKASGAYGLISKPLYASKLIHCFNHPEDNYGKWNKKKDYPSINLNLLVVEDNDINYRMLNKVLVQYNIHSHRATNGLEAVKMLEESNERIDLILMDIEMPVMNGYDATIQIRKLTNSVKANTPIYAMTANTFAEDIAKCISVGMNGHLAKPIDIDKLRKLLLSIEQSLKK